MSSTEIPFVPEGRRIEYVDGRHLMMMTAKVTARKFSLVKDQPSGAVLAHGPELLSFGASGGDYHAHHECERRRLKIPTGEGYEKCPGCHPKNHSEARAIQDAIVNGKRLRHADLYMWGHWFCCTHCWDKIQAAEIGRVFLLKGSEILFNGAHPDNILGRQFDQQWYDEWDKVTVTP